jgi:hypothetical protein
MRFGAIAAGVLLLGFFLLSGGSFGGDRIVQIDFGMYPDLLEGSRVEIDGKIVGELKPYGQNPKSGFEVGKGKHTVRVIHPEFDCEPIEVDLGKPGEKVRLMLDLGERYDEARRATETVITFMR